MTIAIIDRILEKIELEKPLFEFGPCLEDEEIQGFEREHHVRLPTEYREFLLRIGDGTLGPYGIHALQESYLQSSARLASPFPRTESFNPEHEFESNGGGAWANYERFWNQFDCGYLRLANVVVATRWC